MLSYCKNKWDIYRIHISHGSILYKYRCVLICIRTNYQSYDVYFCKRKYKVLQKANKNIRWVWFGAKTLKFIHSFFQELYEDLFCMDLNIFSLQNTLFFEFQFSQTSWSVIYFSLWKTNTYFILKSLWNYIKFGIFSLIQNHNPQFLEMTLKKYV